MNKMIFPATLKMSDSTNVPAAGKLVGELQSTLLRLNLEVNSSELSRKEMGSSTIEAIKVFQAKVGLPTNGKLTKDTVLKINADLSHNFVAKSKTRTQRLQVLLQKAGHTLDPNEVKNRKFGLSTEQALKAIQAKWELPQDGLITEDIVNKLREESLNTKLSSKTQVAQVQRTLLRALNIAKLKDVRVDANELKSRKIGPSTQAAIKAVQNKYGLPATGEIDAMTYDRLTSIAVSIPQPVRQLKAKSATELKLLKKNARLNMKGERVCDVQSVLAFLGYKVDNAEFNNKVFGKSTRDAVLNYQRAHKLVITGHATDDTMKSLNREIQRVNPDVATGKFSYRVRGSVRNELWEGIAGVTVQIWEKLVDVQGIKLAERKTDSNGFFDIPYDTPHQKATKQIKQPFYLQIKALDSANVEIGSKLVFNPTKISWTNFTKGAHPYRGISKFEKQMVAVTKMIGSANITELVETTTNHQISQVAQGAGLIAEDVMQLVLAHHVAAQLNHESLCAEACYAYIAQNLPPSLPSGLINSTEDWVLIDHLVDLVVNGLVFMEDDLKALAFDNAITKNLIPIVVSLQKNEILLALAKTKQTYALEKPILIGNGSLKGLLDLSSIDQSDYASVANTFLKHKNFGPEFWVDVSMRPADFGGADAIKDLKTTVEVGHVTKNFEPMLITLKQMILDPNVQNIKSARDLATLTADDWVELINGNGKQVPANTDGESVVEKVQTYAARMVIQSERMFPSVALVAMVARSTKNPLAHVKDVQMLLDAHPDFDLRTGNLDVFVNQSNINVDEATLTEARVLQRVHRIAPNAVSGQALLDNKIHSSAQIVAMGQDRFIATATKDNQIDQRAARTVYELAYYQYAQVLQRIADYRFDLHRADPKAIVNYTYSKDELPAELIANPNLETLFGSLDFCTYAHCQSVYGPAAYLVDVLRFLDKQTSEIANKTVKDVLFERRPDIGNIKLNCQNTETPLPYIDLVCEVLESAITAPSSIPNFSFQTTRAAAELRAAPEHVREAAYDKLRMADFPLNVAFDFWQVQTRVFLQHLGVPRWELMEAFQSIPTTATAIPSDASIAAEYWEMSTHEAAIIVTVEENIKQKTYWGITSPTIPTEMSVTDFLRRSFLSYDNLLELLYVRWINPLNDSSNVVIERPDATCDTKLQMVVNLSLNRLDKIHRFLRLLRHVSWEVWELDLLIRSPKIGGGILDENCLVRLKQFASLQKRLRLSVDRTLSLFSEINTEGRVKPDQPQLSIPTLYETLFQNSVVVNPVDVAFELPIATGMSLSDVDSSLDHRGTVIAAFSLTDADLERLLVKLPNTELNIANLSKIGRYAWLAKGLGITIKDLLILEMLYSVADIFATPKVTLDFIESVDWVTKSPFTVDELDYLLRVNPDSAYGLREEVITEYINELRQALLSDQGNNKSEIINNQVATVLGLDSEQVQLLLARTWLEGKTFLEVLQDSKLVEQSNTGAFITAVTVAEFPDIYTVFRVLHKSALIILRLKLDALNLAWILTNAEKFGLLQPNILPVTNFAEAPLFPAWLNLVKWTFFKTLYPEPEDISLRAIFELAGVQTTSVTTIKMAIVAVTQWGAEDVDSLVTALSLQHSSAASDFTDIETYLRLHECLRIAGRIGVAPAKISAWAKRDDNVIQSLTAQEVRQTAKSKYDDVVWLEKVTPLEDALREKRRDALLRYLVAYSMVTESPEINKDGKKYPNPAYWQDENDLLKFFLIDVGMSACQLTSRIKQAISSSQMFIQRCLLGLEQPNVDVSRAEQLDIASDNSWKQWEWMKNYRVWEANRKVFLYPENWIEPELRDDKSPFFKELESEILQSDMTDENAEQAFLHYVHKVHEVARLEIVGTYYELDDTDPRDNLPPDINLLHVIGRSRAQPAIYFYRKFDLNYGEWSAWEKIDLDIQSDQVIPVVYNRQLYLFWLSFMEKPQKVKKIPAAAPTPTDRNGKVNSTDSPESPNQLEIQLCWSTHNKDGWTSRKISQQKLIHPWQRPLHSYNLKPRYKKLENLLWLDVYISQSQEFNSTKFWDAYQSTHDYVTKRHPFEETSRPWHSSSFVFDDEVVDVKMKALTGEYHVLDANGLPSRNLSETTSLEYIQDNFGEAGRSINRFSGGYEIGPRLPLPDGMHYHNTKLVNNKRKLNGNKVNVLEKRNTRTLLSGAKSPFEIVASQHSIVFDTAQWGSVPFFYQDNARAFFIKPEWQQVMIGYNEVLDTLKYKFFPFYHPYTSLFMRELKRFGIGGLLNRPIQKEPQKYYPTNTFDFNSYEPGSMSPPDNTAKKDCIDFERYGAYALYNWEIFFHAPLLVACKLSQNQRFEEAMRWFHYIFDPTNTESPDVPQRYWITRPFYEQNSDAYRQQRIQNLLKNIDHNQDQLKAWKNDPFKPHLIARYRPIAYQKTVVMKYIDNLIAWGDQLFRHDTIETINEATMLYALAYELLGRRPIKVPSIEHADKSYNELSAEGGLDPFGNKQVDVLMENFIGTPVRVTREQPNTEPLPTLNVFYFGIPNNDRLLTYWDTIEDRLFKIRHCMNIQGVVRQLPLFEPPIDPALLVKASAAGVNLSSVIAGLADAPAPYRFRQLAQKALEFSIGVQALGDKLLAALEKYDAEGLSLLRSTQEVTLQQAIREIKKQQIKEANESLASLEKSKELAQQKKEFYQSREYYNAEESDSLKLAKDSILKAGDLYWEHILVAGLHLYPNFNSGIAGFGASPTATFSWGPSNIAQSIQSYISAQQSDISFISQESSLGSTEGSFQRRKDEWIFQGQLATTEIAQIEKQIIAAQIRLAIAEKDLENQELQIEQSQVVGEYMHNKYTNQQLYDWQIRQVSSIYFQSYQLAYDMSKRTEKCFQYELGEPAATFIQFGHWNSLKKGLLAGEQLTNDIRRMEAAYLEQNKRDLEITKHVSLAQIFPEKLLMLKETGACNIQLSEWLFDMDYPGHYRRRIKSVSVSIPCVVGPYTSVNCTLSLTNHGIRVNNDITNGYGDPLNANEDRFYKNMVPTLAIATSHGQNDSGMFELNFNDERFLPFEGAGAVSEWQLQLPRENNQFDLATLSDVILHVRYMAKSSGEDSFINAAKASLAENLPSFGSKMFILNQDFSSEWYRFLNSAAGQDQALLFKLGLEHLPFYALTKARIALTKAYLFIEGSEGMKYNVELTLPDGRIEPVLAESDIASNAELVNGGVVFESTKGVLLLGDWQLKIQRENAIDFKSLSPEELRNAYLILGFDARDED